MARYRSLSRANKPGHYSAYPRERPSPRKIWKYSAAAGCLIIILLYFTSAPVPTASDINPFRPTSHPPQSPHNSTHTEGARWHNHWSWLNPFSDSITDDQSQAVLPPLRDRPPIYTFYDAEAEKDEKIKAAENKLLLIWSRAWWAQGFKPVILGKAEAMRNPLYERFQVRRMEHTLGADIMRWLAWGQMGTGILSNWLVLPMGSYEDDLLSFLRRGEYPRLTRYEGLEAGFFSSDKAGIEAALTEALDSTNLTKSKSLRDLVSHKIFTVDPKPSAIAFYDSSTIADHYKSVSLSLTDSKATGYLLLADLISSHLHLTFLNIFSSGIAILTPHRSHSFLLQYPAITLANALINCHPSPLPTSCPPNNPSCKPCSSSKPFSLTTPTHYTNASSLFTIGTLPHPYTLASLLAKTASLSIPHIRRNTARDPWLVSTTGKSLGPSLGGPDRIVPFKESVGSESLSFRSLWVIAEEDSMAPGAAMSKKELEWFFGFALPAYNTTTTTLSLSDPNLKTSAITAVLASPSLYPSSPPNEDNSKDSLGDKELAHQRSLLAHSQSVLSLTSASPHHQRTKRKGNRRVKEGDDDDVSDERVKAAVEAWHLADTEAWRFVRAWRARGREERRRWESEEKRFVRGWGDE
ncbi:MAG: hypothetical protein Q9182_005152 [Xanthomendoza sp. 2 TL-2023]